MGLEVASHLDWTTPWRCIPSSSPPSAAHNTGSPPASWPLAHHPVIGLYGGRASYVALTARSSHVFELCCGAFYLIELIAPVRRRRTVCLERRAAPCRPWRPVSWTMSPTPPIGSRTLPSSGILTHLSAAICALYVLLARFAPLTLRTHS